MNGFPRVKICGIRSDEDAKMAIDAGAHAIAFNFVRGSKRYINPEAAREIIWRLPPFIAVVGVFADEPRYSIEEIATLCRLHVLQFHGNESASYCKKWSYPIIKALRFGESVPGNVNVVTTAFDQWEKLCEAAQEYDVDAFLVDAYSSNELGGAGKTFDWSKVKNQLPKPMILAGGLNPENVGEAIAIVRPFGVDVASGVETDGKKDRQKVFAFVEAARKC